MSVAFVGCNWGLRGYWPTTIFYSIGLYSFRFLKKRDCIFCYFFVIQSRVHCQTWLPLYIANAPLAAAEAGRDFSCSERKETTLPRKTSCQNGNVQYGSNWHGWPPGTWTVPSRTQNRILKSAGPCEQRTSIHAVWPSLPATRLPSSPTICISK